MNIEDDLIRALIEWRDAGGDPAAITAIIIRLIETAIDNHERLYSHETQGND